MEKNNSQKLVLTKCNDLANFLLTVADILNRKRHTAILIAVCIMTLAAIMTFTKSFVMLVASIIVMLAYYSPILKKMKGIIWVEILSIFLFLSHFSIVSKLNFEQNKYFHALEKTPFAEVGDDYLLRTCYGVLKETNMIAFMRHPLVGLGGGNFTAFTRQLKTEGIYPTYLSDFDPL